jgi:hypothetical protein
MEEVWWVWWLFVIACIPFWGESHLFIPKERLRRMTASQASGTNEDDNPKKTQTKPPPQAKVAGVPC